MRGVADEYDAALVPTVQFERFDCGAMNLLVALQVCEIGFDQAPKLSKAFAQPFQPPQRGVMTSFRLIDVAKAVGVFVADRKKAEKASVAEPELHLVRGVMTDRRQAAPHHLPNIAWRDVAQR